MEGNVGRRGIKARGADVEDLEGRTGGRGEKSGGESDPGVGGALIFWVGREGRKEGNHP